MDWKKLKEKMVNIKDKTIEKSKHYSEKALGYTTDSIRKSGMTLKEVADFEKAKENKYLVIFFIKNNDKESDSIMLNLPVLLTKAWIEGATLKVCDILEARELARQFDIKNIPTVITFKKQELSRKIENLDEVKIFIRDFKL